MPSRPPAFYPRSGVMSQRDYRQRAKKEIDERRGTSAQRGYDARWRKARKLYLARNPLCVECMKVGQATTATVVDHITPHRGDEQLFWDVSNWRALCKPCHDAATAREVWHK